MNAFSEITFDRLIIGASNVVVFPGQRSPLCAGPVLPLV